MPKQRNRRRQRGVVIVLASVGLLVTLLVVGLSTDLGLAFVAKARLAKAVDAAALAAARNTSKGQATMRTLATQVANANYPTSGTSYDIMIDTESIDTTRVTVTGASSIPTLFARVMGPQSVSMRAMGEATRFPLDLSLVLDVSKSLEYSDSFDDLQAAAKAFVARFDPTIDQVGLVQFSTAGSEVVTIQKAFTTPIYDAVDAMSAIAWTNIDEGLRIGRAQVDGAPVRTRAIKVIVLFTDGRPTAFRDTITVPSPPSTYDGVVTVDSHGNAIRGLYDPTTGDEIQTFDGSGRPQTSSSGYSRGGRGGGSGSANLVRGLPGGVAATGAGALAMAMAQAEGQANLARAAGHRIYCIGLGNLDADEPEDQPDLDLLRRIANEGGMTDASQPRGQMVFAPSAADLNTVFGQVADRILTRLTR
jgi:Flp pilus assembly protein TadG